MKQHSGLTKYFLIIPTMLLLFTVLAPAVNATCTYSPREEQCLFFGCWYEHVRNGLLEDQGECWTGTTPMSTMTCGSPALSYTIDAFDFSNYLTNRTRYQDIPIPNNLTDTNWELVYYLTANDPNQEGWFTSLKAEIKNVSDGGTVASQVWWGDDAPLACGQRKLTFQGNFAGKTLRIYFEGRNPTPAVTVIRVGDIELMQS